MVAGSAPELLLVSFAYPHEDRSLGGEESEQTTSCGTPISPFPSWCCSPYPSAGARTSRPTCGGSASCGLCLPTGACSLEKATRALGKVRPEGLGREYHKRFTSGPPRSLAYTSRTNTGEETPPAGESEGLLASETLSAKAWIQRSRGTDMNGLGNSTREGVSRLSNLKNILFKLEQRKTTQRSNQSPPRGRKQSSPRSIGKRLSLSLMYKREGSEMNTPRSELSWNFPHPKHNTNGCTFNPSLTRWQIKSLQMEPPLRHRHGGSIVRAPGHGNRHMMWPKQKQNNTEKILHSILALALAAPHSLWPAECGCHPLGEAGAVLGHLRSRT